MHEDVSRVEPTPAVLRRIRNLLRQVMLQGVKDSQMPKIVEALREINRALGET